MINFTVLIPVYNTPPSHLIQAFYSVYHQQDVTGYEIVLVNDGSDNPETLLALEMLSKLPRVTIIHHTLQKGSPAARNTGLKAITTEYVAMMDSDDISAPNRFKMQLNYLQQRPVDVLGTNLFGFTNALTMQPVFATAHKQIPDYNQGWLTNHGTIFCRRQALLSSGGYDEKQLRVQDIVLWQRMYQLGYTFENVEDVLYAWRRYTADGPQPDTITTP
jgi:glycosyltransferase involved in cell wall biosynthesis